MRGDVCTIRILGRKAWFSGISTGRGVMMGLPGCYPGSSFSKDGVDLNISQTGTDCSLVILFPYWYIKPLIQLSTYFKIIHFKKSAKRPPFEFLEIESMNNENNVQAIRVGSGLGQCKTWLCYHLSWLINYSSQQTAFSDFWPTDSTIAYDVVWKYFTSTAFLSKASLVKSLSYLAGFALFRHKLINFTALRAF